MVYLAQNSTMKINSLIVGLFLIFLTSCETQPTSPSNQNLAGTYVLTSLQSNVAVDLDGNGTTSTDLMTEVACLRQFTVTFNVDGSFTALIADADFNPNNVLVCTTRTESGTYTYVNGLLTVTIVVNGGTVTESEQAILNATNFSFTLDSGRISQFFSSIAGTPANGITNLDFVYTRI